MRTLSFRFDTEVVVLFPLFTWTERITTAFFYRDSHPVGWNTANGGAESINELLTCSPTFSGNCKRVDCR